MAFKPGKKTIGFFKNKYEENEYNIRWSKHPTNSDWVIIENHKYGELFRFERNGPFVYLFGKYNTMKTGVSPVKLYIEENCEDMRKILDMILPGLGLVPVKINSISRQEIREIMVVERI